MVVSCANVKEQSKVNRQNTSNRFLDIPQFSKKWKQLLVSLCISIFPPMIAAMPAKSAERINVDFGVLDLGVSVRELEIFAKEDKVGKELDFYLSRLGGVEQRQYVREFLTFSAGFTQLQVAQFFYSSMGEQVLTYMGNLIQAGNQNGNRAIRAAFILAAGDPDGLTTLNFLKYFPTTILRLNTTNIFSVVRKIENMVEQTRKTIATIEDIAAQEARSEPPLNLDKMNDLGVRGNFQFKQETVNLKYPSRDRTLITDLYMPQGLSSPAPVIVMSHGLASNRKHFTRFAQLLASYGFVVAVPQHPGSDTEQMQRLLKGRAKEVFATSEFIDRPQDLSFVLDELGRRFPNQVNVEQAGVAGHSFGGYTALAMGGATIDFEHLAQDCKQGLDPTNVSLLLQCDALKLPRQNYNFTDKRIKLVIAINPVHSSIFGSKGISQIQVPVIIAASSDDPVAPAVLEQVQPFTWLTTPHRYLFFAKGVSHVADIRTYLRVLVPNIADIIPPQDLEPLKEYSGEFFLAAIETYVANRPEYRPYLQASYAIAKTQDPHKASVITSLTEAQFQQLLKGANR